MNGYQIPEGTFVFRIGFLASIDPKYFKQPDMFLPERWIRGTSLITKYLDKNLSYTLHCTVLRGQILMMFLH